MIEFGNALRSAREAKGYTIRQLAEITHLPPKQVEDLEEENFSRIVAPIYGRGFVKLYCEAVGLDPRPMVTEFMEIYSGNRDTGIKERPSSATNVESGDDAPTDVDADSDVSSSLPDDENGGIIPTSEAFQLQGEVLPPQTEEPTDQPDLPDDSPKEEPEGEVFEGITNGRPSPYRYAAPIRQSKSAFTIKPSIWRMVALTIGVIVILGVIAIGIRALYRATSNGGQTVSENTIGAEEVPQPTAIAETATLEKAGKVPRKPQSIPQLYLY